MLLLLREWLTLKIPRHQKIQKPALIASSSKTTQYGAKNCFASRFAYQIFFCVQPLFVCTTWTKQLKRRFIQLFVYMIQAEDNFTECQVCPYAVFRLKIASLTITQSWDVDAYLFRLYMYMTRVHDCQFIPKATITLPSGSKRIQVDL